MTTYQYSCAGDGVFDVRLPMGSAPASHACPSCRRDAARVFSPPLLSFGSRPAREALDRAEKSRAEPELVTSIPTAGRRRRTPTAPPNPALRRLPRP